MNEMHEHPAHSLVGRRLGAYDVLSRLGVGGMGEVYRARDRKLAREVALKVLPAAIANDPERHARFEREARLLAALNHPHIATIHGFEEHAGIHMLVMELVEGPTLTERLADGPIPVQEALTVARQIADALEAAHEKGVIHRDLKPANIKLRPDGTVKVLDFGIAKASESHKSIDLPAGTTVTALETRAGLILGTPAYMSPEQARGQRVDKRTDIWAFGCVLYEMLTGRRAFAGETVSDTIACVLERDPDWSKLEAGPPPAVRRLLGRCLEKDPKQRLRDIGDARLELDDAWKAPDDSSVSAPARRSRVNAPWMAAGLMVTAVMASVLGWTLKPPVTPALSHLSHLLPAEVSLAFGSPASVVTIAPDGSSLVYAATDALYRRALSEPEAVPIRGTEGAPRAPFFSPDGLSVGYWDSAASELRRIAVAGGTPVSLTRATTPYGASWESDDTILYGQADGIWRLSAEGGAPEQIVRIEATELLYGPRLLPDGRSVMFSVVTRSSMIGQNAAWDTARIVVQSLESGERTEVVRGGDARLVPTGHLVYALGTVLFSVPFDHATRQVRGAPVSVAEGVQRAGRGSGGQGGSANYDVSRNGTLVYARGPEWVHVPRRLLAVDLQGNAQPLIDDQRDYWRPRISPDGTRVAVEVLQPDLYSHIWIVDLERRRATPLSVDAESGYVAWAPDGESVIYRKRVTNLYRQLADGSRAAQPLLKNPEPTVRVMDISQSGIVAFASKGPQDDIGTLDLASGAVADFLVTPAREFMASFSPDGKWLAYTSNESGRNEVYVRPFPRTEGIARLVSIDGGAGPVWAPNGETLYYRAASGFIMAVPVTLSATLAVGRPEPVFRFAGTYRMSNTATAYDIHPDGKRFIMVSESDDQGAASPPHQVQVVINWLEELPRLVPMH
jgi:serine/threonine protein kinase/Tol biopolymer transport system component